MSEILPDIFLRVELGAIGGQAEKADVVRGFEGFGGVPTRSVNDHNGMRPLGNLTTDLDKVGVHGRGVGMRHDQCRTHTAGRTNRAKDVGAFISLVAHGAWSCACLAPDIGERSLLAYASFILNPDFKRLATGVSGEDFRDFGRKVFLKAA